MQSCERRARHPGRPNRPARTGSAGVTRGRSRGFVAHGPVTPNAVTTPAQPLSSTTGRASGLNVGRQPRPVDVLPRCENPTVRAISATSVVLGEAAGYDPRGRSRCSASCIWHKSARGSRMRSLRSRTASASRVRGLGGEQVAAPVAGLVQRARARRALVATAGAAPRGAGGGAYPCQCGHRRSWGLGGWRCPQWCCLPARAW